MELDRPGHRVAALGAIVLLVALVLAATAVFGPTLVTAAPGSAAGGAAAVTDDGTGLGDAAGDAGNDVGFREVSADAGFRYNASEPAGIIADSGVFAGDYDDDGWTDLLALGGARPVLFHNDGGTFSRSGELDGVERSVRSAVFLDHDADGDTDLLLLPEEGRPILLETAGDDPSNDGAGDGDVLVRADPDAVPVELVNPVGAAAGDYDRDGCPDVFVAQNGDWLRHHPAGTDTADVPAADDNGARNVLLRGTCDGFENATAAAGISGTSWSLATSMVDLDGDGYQDVHVANDFNNDVVYWNDGDGTFTRTTLSEETNRNAMASEVADFTGDGRLDVFVTNILLPENVSGDVAFVADGRDSGNNLLVNRGDRRFEPSADRCGVAEGGWGWAAIGADLDNDGDQDLLHATLEFSGRLGSELLRARQAGQEYSYPALFVNRGEGCSFATADAAAAGLEQTDGHGLAQVDFDRDGDVDVALAESGGTTGSGRFRLYENVGADGTGAVQVRLVGDAPAYGTRVTVTAGDGTVQHRVHTSRSDYFSQDERVLHVGTGELGTAAGGSNAEGSTDGGTVDVRVTWPDGTEHVVEDVDPGTRLRISRAGLQGTVALDGASDPGSPLAVLSRIVPRGLLPGGDADAVTGLGLLGAVTVIALLGGVGYRRYRRR